MREHCQLAPSICTLAQVCIRQHQNLHLVMAQTMPMGPALVAAAWEDSCALCVAVCLSLRNDGWKRRVDILVLQGVLEG